MALDTLSGGSVLDGGGESRVLPRGRDVPPAPPLAAKLALGTGQRHRGLAQRVQGTLHEAPLVPEVVQQVVEESLAG